MAKQAKNLSFSELEVDKELMDLIIQCENGKKLDALESTHRHKLWERMLSLIKKTISEELSNSNINVLRKCIEFILSVLNMTNIGIEIKQELIPVVIYLNSNEFWTEDSSIINNVSKINEYWMVKVQSLDEIPGMEYFTLRHLFNICSCDKPHVSDLQRLSAIRKSITSGPFDKAVPSLRPLLIKFIQNMQVLHSEHGLRFIAQVMILSQKIMTELHKTIMLDLGSCNRKKASKYGKIYVMAWHAAAAEMKTVLEKNCFQHLMESIFKEQRTSLELNKNSLNILAVLEVWHAERKKKNPDFVTMITDAYQPILWKYLKSGFNVHRCNATDVFFKAFPLQRSNDNAVDAEKLFNMQFDAMLSSLTDDCHIVRIIGIREVCNILAHYWNSFNPVQIQTLMSVITKQDASDASSAEVRRMVYIGLQSLVKSPLSCEYIKQILPNMANNIHDVNQKVRISFIQLLICIKEKKDPNFKYSDVVSMFNLQYRLAVDNIAVGQWIVKLLMKNYYHSKMPTVEWTKRFIYLIKTYKASYRNFFFYSSKSLPFSDACTIINEILSQLGTFVISKSTSDPESENIVENLIEKKKGNKRVPLSNWNESKVATSTTSEAKKCAFDDPDVVAGLFDIVTILWVLHDIKLNKPENEEVRCKLYGNYIMYAQPFINYYKDTNLFMRVLSLSGNIPASLLRSNSITLPGYCMKMLKTLKLNRSEEENEKVVSMLIALVKWGRGSEILEQVTLWLDAAFETKNLNETILPRRRVKINETIQPDSIVAINILDALLKKEYVKLSILKKNYHELFALWKFMSRIKKMIEARLDLGEPFSEDIVSDQFLTLCFRRYVKLIPLLKEDCRSDEEKENQSQCETSQVFVNHQKEIENVIEWAENLLFPLLQQEDLEDVDVDLITTLLEDVLYVSDNMIIVHLVNNLFHFKSAHFVLKLLNTRYGARFVKAASRITVALNFSAKLLFQVNDDFQIFSTVIPSLLSHTLNVLTNQNLSGKDIEKLEEGMPIIKTSFGKVLATYQDNLKSASGLKERVRQLKLVVSFFVDCVVAIVSQGIPREDATIPLFESFSQLPPVACSLLSLFYNKKTWTPLFLHVINSKLLTRSYDTKSTVSAVLLLHLYANLDKKSNPEDLKKALVAASNCLKRFKESVGKKEEKDCGQSMETETTTTKKTWPSNAATRNSSTWTGLLSRDADKENISKEGIANDETNPSQTNVLSFQCKEDNLELDLINCGFEVIKNAEAALEQETGKEVDEV